MLLWDGARWSQGTEVQEKSMLFCDIKPRANNRSKRSIFLFAVSSEPTRNDILSTNQKDGITVYKIIAS